MLHGWVYNIGSGEVLCYNSENGEFVAMDQAAAEEQLARAE
jgi:carbonic anhydrase